MNSITRTFPYPIKKANTFGSRLKGLMFRKKPIYQEGLWIVPCNSIHMFFMNFPIDAVFINKEREIVKLVQDLQPWKIVSPIKNAHSVIELPAGTIKEFNLKVGEIVDI